MLKPKLSRAMSRTAIAALRAYAATLPDDGQAIAQDTIAAIQRELTRADANKMRLRAAARAEELAARQAGEEVIHGATYASMETMPSAADASSAAQA